MAWAESCKVGEITQRRERASQTAGGQWGGGESGAGLPEVGAEVGASRLVPGAQFDQGLYSKSNAT